uniref:Uncharacterized protein n=1 Tax=Candidatus Kentrum sp. LFY TaxID=2126342 RepID=A0A450UD86_9GAMM|nr:MAG: hypothetical protein BECKLFY1418A_GA0070994_100810 [Candidatus Kentron sp. LFY]VFJ90278.1 MAG: hypothetical protein BECKLFY1418B_GA0070995_101923 [Candidatus Kentron sp. LFY]
MKIFVFHHSSESKSLPPLAQSRNTPRAIQKCPFSGVPRKENIFDNQPAKLRWQKSRLTNPSLSLSVFCVILNLLIRFSPMWLYPFDVYMVCLVA